MLEKYSPLSSLTNEVKTEQNSVMKSQGNTFIQATDFVQQYSQRTIKQIAESINTIASSFKPADTMPVFSDLIEKAKEGLGQLNDFASMLDTKNAIVKFQAPLHLISHLTYKATESAKHFLPASKHVKDLEVLGHSSVAQPFVDSSLGNMIALDSAYREKVNVSKLLVRINQEREDGGMGYALEALSKLVDTLRYGEVSQRLGIDNLQKIKNECVAVMQSQRTNIFQKQYAARIIAQLLVISPAFQQLEAEDDTILIPLNRYKL
tara:strand:- start:504 stop:1295 length:792 start_codon:yes stop_codon:yes gene_type:complete